MEAPGYASVPWAPLQVGSVFTLARRENVKRPALIFVDECHHARAATWETVMNRWPGVPRIGLTATPQRLDGKGLGQHFAAMVLGPSVKQMEVDGYLAPMKVLRIPTSMTRKGMRKNKNGEFQKKDMRERIDDRMVGDAVAAYLQYTPDRKAIFFGVHRDHSRRVADRFNERGIRAEHVDGNDHTARRKRVMEEFRHGNIDVVCNVALIDEGFDAPSCDAVIDASWTTSVVRYLQRAGRAKRPAPNKVATLLDLVGNSYELGLPDEVREWSLADGEVASARETNATMPSTCGNCHASFIGRVCPWCNFETPLDAIDEVAVALEIAKPTPKKAKPTGRRKELNRELSMAWRSTDPAREIMAIGERRGYKPGWAFHILKMRGLA